MKEVGFKIVVNNNTYLFKDMNGYVGLPDNYMIISTTKDISEEQAKGIVDTNFVTYKDYTGVSYPRTDYTNENGFDTAKESLKSLIQYKGLDINKNYLILRKIF